MSSALIDLESTCSQSPTYSSTLISQSTQDDLLSLLTGYGASSGIKTWAAPITPLTTIMTSHTKGPDHHSASDIVEVTAAPGAGQSLATRSSNTVIADLKKGRKASQLKASGKGTAEWKVHNHSTKHAEIEDSIVDGDADDEESEDVGDGRTIPEPQIKKVSEARRYDFAVFNSFIQGEQKRMARAAKITVTRNDESQSTKWLVKQSESQQIIASPRDYQVELFERAKEKNIIAVLDTGSGKTLIAVLLLRHIINQELEDRAIGKQRRISFFLVDSVALVFQQYAVLECNLDQKMNRFCGEMGCDLWSKELWQKHFSENMVIVCTAEVLYQCLHHSFISMSQINLLVFDEAHHAKKNHSYARILKDFYAQEDIGTQLPKIFGMTASPVDAKVDVKRAAAELEALLHCQIATVSDLSLLQYTAPKKEEQFLTYPPLAVPFETPLYQKMKAKLGNSEVFAKPLNYAKEVSSELGSWLSDQVWPLCLSEDETMKLQAKTGRRFHAIKGTAPTVILDKQIQNITEAQEIVASHTFQKLQLTMEHLSSKVICLVEYLRSRFEHPTEDKCIIFVRQRYTARLLTELFSQEAIGTPHLRAGSLVGTRTGEVGDLNVSVRQQIITMSRFRKGLLNCLFATSVAEEGIDIPDCNLVIRFDLYSTLIQYIQSRGRARLANSKYVHMMENGNRQHIALIKGVHKDEGILREFCNSLPADRLLSGNDFDMDYFLAKEKTHRVYKEPTTGAKLTYRMSLMVLANFVGSLPQSVGSIVIPEYVMTLQGKKFICEVILPENSPVRGAVGRPAATKQVAKCSAAFETCLLLRAGNYLDAHLLPTYVKQLPAMRNAHLAVSSKKQSAYKMRTKPSVWAGGSIPEELFLTVLSLADPDCLRRPSQPIGLLTRCPLPQLPSFPIFLGEGRKSLVLMQPVPVALNLDVAKLDIINKFTLRIFEDIFSKEYQSDISKMPYFLVPISPSYIASPDARPAKLVAWDILATVDQHDFLQWDEMTPHTFFEDRYMVDPWDGSRKLWSVKVAPGYKPLDSVPPNTAPRNGTRKNNNNIMEYSISLWSKARARRTFSETQPVLEAEYIPLTRNLLDDTKHRDPDVPRKCFVIPEPLKISSLPTRIVAMAYVFPAIIHRIESYLIALEACGTLKLDIRPDLALEAMTKDSDNTDDHNGEQIHFQRGMGKNYERLEFIGDCFLKMATSISLYSRYPDDDEYQSHVKRMLMICNQNLFNVALKLDLSEYIRSQSFNRRAWYPEGLILKKGKAATAPAEQSLGDKTIADVSEALIGAALLTDLDKTRNLDQAVRAVTMLVCSEDHEIKTFAEYYHTYEKPKYQTSASTGSQRDLALQLEGKHAYKFKYPRIARSAFVHPSYPFSYEFVPCYQRLEFLGDSLLDMACVNFLFHRHPDRDPQWLTEHKMAMVSNQFLGALCVSMGFHKHLLQFSGVIQKHISDYVTDITECRLQAEEDAKRDGKAPENFSPDYWIHSQSPPKCLPDIVEAYIGAVFVDSEYNYAEVERFFEEHIRFFFENMNLYDSYANKNPVTYLSNFLGVSMGCQKWRFHSKQLPDIGDGAPPQIIATVMIHSKIVVGSGGSSSRYARIAAAKKGLELLSGLPREEYRKAYQCDCKNADGDEMVEELESSDTLQEDMEDNRLEIAI